MTVQDELELLTKRGREVPQAEDVVSFARNPETALHSKFQWDDTRAAEQYRLIQAMDIIKVHIFDLLVELADVFAAIKRLRRA